jgi:hypothetical protein
MPKGIYNRTPEILAKQKENLERQKDRLRKHAEAKGYK